MFTDRMPTADPILTHLRARLERLYGERLARVMLFGSRARGEARVDSDYDVAVFLRGMTDRWQEFDRLNLVVSDILYGHGAFVHALPYAEGQYGEPTPLMQEIRREGVEI
jgi:predicted nucleotidyltransferase